jgi:hypothetical protein
MPGTLSTQTYKYLLIQLRNLLSYYHELIPRGHKAFTAYIRYSRTVMDFRRPSYQSAEVRLDNPRGVSVRHLDASSILSR